VFPTLNSNESYCLSIKQDRLQFTTNNYILLCLCFKLIAALEMVVVASAGGEGGGDVK
jgi:hypothetical protein